MEGGLSKARTRPKRRDAWARRYLLATRYWTWTVDYRDRMESKNCPMLQRRDSRGPSVDGSGLPGLKQTGGQADSNQSQVESRRLRDDHRPPRPDPGSVLTSEAQFAHDAGRESRLNALHIRVVRGEHPELLQKICPTIRIPLLSD